MAATKTKLDEAQASNLLNATVKIIDDLGSGTCRGVLCLSLYVGPDADMKTDGFAVFPETVDSLHLLRRMHAEISTLLKAAEKKYAAPSPMALHVKEHLKKLMTKPNPFGAYVPLEGGQKVTFTKYDHQWGTSVDIKTHYLDAAEAHLKDAALMDWTPLVDKK